MRHDAARTREAIRSEQIRLNHGWHTKAEIEAAQLHMAELEKKMAKLEQRGRALFEVEE